jgi:hypothetical protein
MFYFVSKKAGSSPQKQNAPGLPKYLNKRYSCTLHYAMLIHLPQILPRRANLR